MTLIQPVYAQVNIADTWPLAKNFTSLASLLSFLIPKILLFSGIIFFILIVIAGIGMVSGGGGDDSHAQEKAKMFLTYAVIGLMIIFGAYWILQVISFITGGSLSSILGS